MKEDLIKEFRNRFHKAPEKIFFCPGRVNLMGEHIDYNGGRVMPCAILSGTWLAVSRNIDKVFRFHCLNFPEVGELHLQTSYSKSGKGWFNYPLGIINQFLQDGHDLSGLDMFYYGNLPIGAGLSSSASIEVLTAYAINDFFSLGFSHTELALLSKKVENEFIGVNCGIMDQFAVAMGQKDKAILLDCNTLAYEYIPFETGDLVLTIVNSNKQRRLAESKYNERFAECEEILRTLQKGFAIQQLCDLQLYQFDSARELIRDPVLEKRALHVISENARVTDAVIALQTGDLVTFGKLMYASHQSLKEYYEVSGPELDAIVEFCKTYPGCMGARMTGAGFGGCAIALVKRDRLDDFTLKLLSYYRNKVGYEPGVFVSEAGEGVSEFKL